MSARTWAVPISAAAVLVAAGIGIRQLSFRKDGGKAIAEKPSMAGRPFRDRSPLSPREKEILQSRPTEDPEAFRPYASGPGLDDIRIPGDARKAIDTLLRAIELNPEQAPAYLRLANAYIRIGDVRAKDAAQQALALDDALPEAHATLASVLIEFDWNWKGAELELKKALALDPNCAPAHHGYGRLLLMLGRLDESIAELERARELVPDDVATSRNLGFAYIASGQVDRAIRQLRDTLRMNPDFFMVKEQLTLAYFLKSMHREILELWNWDPRDPMVRLVGLCELAERDRQKAVDLLDRSSENLSGFNASLAYALLGERDKVCSSLERAFEEEAREPDLKYLKAIPLFDQCRSDPRFRGLLKKMGLD